MRKRPLFPDGPEVGVIGLNLSSPPTASLPLNQLATLAPPSDDPRESGEHETADTIRHALELGVSFFDTDWITANGHAQEVLGRTLKGIDRDGVLIAAKAGPRLTFHGDLTVDNTRANLINQAHDSLFRLKMQHFDLYQVHWPDNTPPEQTARGLQDVIHAGQARWAGACNHGIEQVRVLASHLPLQTVQAPLSVLDRRALSELIPWCTANGAGFLASEPLLFGLLSGRFKGDEEFTDEDRDEFFTQPKFGRVVAFARALDNLYPDYTGAQLAVAWCLAQDGVSCVLVPPGPPGEMSALAEVAENPPAGGQLKAVEELVLEHGFGEVDR